MPFGSDQGIPDPLLFREFLRRNSFWPAKMFGLKLPKKTTCIESGTSCYNKCIIDKLTRNDNENWKRKVKKWKSSSLKTFNFPAFIEVLKFHSAKDSFLVPVFQVITPKDAGFLTGSATFARRKVHSKGPNFLPRPEVLRVTLHRDQLNVSKLIQMKNPLMLAF